LGGRGCICRLWGACAAFQATRATLKPPLFHPPPNRAQAWKVLGPGAFHATRAITLPPPKKTRAQAWTAAREAAEGRLRGVFRDVAGEALQGHTPMDVNRMRDAAGEDNTHMYIYIVYYL
jgi:hypothetical protein